MRIPSSKRVSCTTSVMCIYIGIQYLVIALASIFKLSIYGQGQSSWTFLREKAYHSSSYGYSSNSVTCVCLVVCVHTCTMYSVECLRNESFSVRYLFSPHWNEASPRCIRIVWPTTNISRRSCMASRKTKQHSTTPKAGDFSLGGETGMIEQGSR